jgi:hypothetical protein
MMFTGTLIADLMATVERVEQSSHSEENLICEFLTTEGLISLAQQNDEYDPKLFWQQSGVA